MSEIGTTGGELRHPYEVYEDVDPDQLRRMRLAAKIVNKARREPYIKIVALENRDDSGAEEKTPVAIRGEWMVREPRSLDLYFDILEIVEDMESKVLPVANTDDQ